MKKNNNKFIIIGIIILIALGSGVLKKEAGEVSRSFSVSTLQPNTDFDITYTSSSGFTGIEETVPAGFILVSSDSLTSLENGLLKSAWTGSSKTITLRSPGTDGTYTFSGNYETTGDLVGAIIGQSSINVVTCITQNTFSCFSDDVYWYDSCGTMETVKEDCGEDSTGTWGLDYCDSNNIKHDRTNFDRGCSGTACFITPSVESEIVTSCTWQCLSAKCQRNTAADVNNDGTVALSELIDYAELWVANSGVTLTELIDVAEIWVSGGESPVEI